MSQVKLKDTVRVHYTGKLDNGQIFDSSLQREPLEFTLGEGQLIPGFEQGVLDMKVNEKKTIQIPHTEAYGEVKEELFHEVEKDKLPEELQLEEGMGLISKAPDGTERQLVLHEIKEDTIVVDANHPLAGKDLTFELELVEIK
jgi:FKBP-type peptidyl-prolyl cis-trans isomerase SlpA